MLGYEATVELTIREPLAVYESNSHPTRHICCRPAALASPYDRGFLRVVVDYEEGAGRVLTAFPVSAAKATERIQLWPIGNT